MIPRLRATPRGARPKSDAGLDTPHIDVILCGRDGPLPVERALLDTGATWSVLPGRLMEDLGIRRDECRETDTRTANGPGIALAAETETGHVVFVRVQVAGYSIPIPAFFSDHADDGPVLGVSDFLRWFRLEFDPMKPYLALHPAPNTPRIQLVTSQPCPPPT